VLSAPQNLYPHRRWKSPPHAEQKFCPIEKKEMEHVNVKTYSTRTNDENKENKKLIKI